MGQSGRKGASNHGIPPHPAPGLQLSKKEGKSEHGKSRDGKGRDFFRREEDELGDRR